MFVYDGFVLSFRFLSKSIAVFSVLAGAPGFG